MTVRLSRQPTKGRRGPPKAYQIDRPPGGYHVKSGSVVTSHLAHLDHASEIRRCLTKIEKADAAMTKLETRIDRITDKLNDPNLLDEIPTDDPRRLEAEDLRDELSGRYQRNEWTVQQAAGDIATHGVYLAGEWNADELHAIGRELSTVDGPLARILATCPGIETHQTYLTLCREAVAF